MNDSRDSESPFGVLDFLSWDHPWNKHHYTPTQLERVIPLMKEAGVSFVRIDFLWADIELGQEGFSFDKYDRLVELFNNNGIKILAVLCYSPAWADHWNNAPDAVHFTRYAQAVVHRYKHIIRHWQIWNEPDHEMFWKPQDQMRSYTLLLRHLYPGIKSIDSTALIHLGGLSKSLPSSLQNIYLRGGKDYFDVVDIHPFVDPLLPDSMAGLEALYKILILTMQQNNDPSKPIWFTVLGCPGVSSDFISQDWWLGKNPTEEQQAQWLERMYRTALAWPRVQKIFWALFRDTDQYTGTGVDHMGLIRFDFSKKPSFEAYRRMASSHSAAR